MLGEKMNDMTTNPEQNQLARVSVASPDADSSGTDCATLPPEEPCTVVIMGATGDLTARKLIPSLVHMYQNERLPESFTIVGCGRTRLSDEQFRNKLSDDLESANLSDRSGWTNFSKLIYYQPVESDDPDTFDALAGKLKQLDQKHYTRGNRLYYLALPPDMYVPFAQGIGQAGLGVEKANGNGWSRLVVEKPFGRDLETAIELDRRIHKYFREHQVFRIDHYLAKETVQNILMFRFANSIFEPVWNRRYVDHVEITAVETLGVEHRADYYEQSGVLRDMFQNHMMQLLALTAMEPPSAFEADRVRDERVKVFRALRPFEVDRLQDRLVLGQYAGGSLDGKKLPAYRDEPGVDPRSLTPTFASMKVFIDNWRWQGVPFYLTSGKRLAQKITEINIQFKQVPHSMFRHVIGPNISANRLTLGIYPDETIKLTFQTKFPGARVCLRAVTMDFHYYRGNQQPVLDAYEKVLLDCMRGDHMLFWRQDAVEQCWSYLTPILAECETCGDRDAMLHPYPAGSIGPAELVRFKAGLL
jgi:glucose-6-phosphate 1-dehydrogenase